MGWIKKSSPTDLINSGRPSSSTITSSEESLNNLVSKAFNEHLEYVLKRLILSIEHCHSPIGLDSNKSYPLIDLLVIDKAICDNSKELKSDEYWRTFLDKHKLLFKASDLQQSEPSLNVDD